MKDERGENDANIHNAGNIQRHFASVVFGIDSHQWRHHQE